MSDPVTTALTSGTSDLQTEILAGSVIGLGVGAAVFAVSKGWKKLKGNI